MTSEPYLDLRRAYAFTTHKLQGASIDNVYLAFGEGMTGREMAYVQGSRHRETLMLYATEEAVGEHITKIARRTDRPDHSLVQITKKSPLAKIMEKSRKQEMAMRFTLEQEVKSIEPKLKP